MKPVRSLTALKTLLLAVIATILMSGLLAGGAQACRDCPFPMHIGNGRWLMPEGYSELVIEEIPVRGGKIQSVVRLYDSTTGQILAEGKILHSRGRKRLRLDLADASGGEMKADLYFPSSDRTQIQVKITCKACNLRSSYYN